MEKSNEYLGANWARVDLHLHSPGVETFVLPSGCNVEDDEDKKKIVSEYVNKLKEAEIKVGAITDYNGIREEWFTPIQTEAKKQGITILPGVELSITGGKYGLHLLLVLEESLDVDGFNRFLHSIDKNPQEDLVNGRKNREIDSKYELETLIKEIKSKYNSIVIFPHPEDDKGLFKTFSPKEAAKHISSIRPDAIEYFSDEWESKLVSTNEIKKEDLEKIAVIEGSDPKSIEEIGTKKRNEKQRATYVKLSEFSLDALKLALHDSKVRINLYDKPKMYHTRIKKVNINGTTFLKNVEIDFSPELNTLIGGRGVGKSAIIESIRYCLDLPIYSEETEKSAFVNGVIGSGGEVSVEIDKYYGDKKSFFKIKRIHGKEPEIYDENNERMRFRSPREIFEKERSPMVIGQKELYFISQNENFLLQLVDQLIGEKIKNKQNEFENLINTLKENGRKIIDLEKNLAKKDEYEQELKSAESKIKEYEKLGVADRLKKYTQIIEDDEKVRHSTEKIVNIIERIKNTFTETKSELSGIVTSLRRGKSEKKNILEGLATESENMKEIIERLQIVEELNRAYERFKEITNNWNAEKQKAEKEIEEIKRKLGEQKLQPERLEDLTKRKAQLEGLLKDFKKYEDNLNSVRRERENIKQQMKIVRHELFKIREKEIDDINKKLNGKVKIKVIYEGDKKNFKKYLTNLLQGSGIHKDAIDSITNAQKITLDGILISEFITLGKDTIIEKFNLTEKMADKLIEYFKDKNKLFVLETLFPDDLIEIELNVDGKYISLNNLSPGQKATALLLIMFITEDRILILDQPEEDLDNRFIYEDVVNILRDLKGKKQIITATHNANIPVLGDSELIVVLDKQDGHCKIVDKGSIDKQSIKEQVKRIMEGGQEAFLRRAEKYGGIL